MTVISGRGGLREHTLVPNAKGVRFFTSIVVSSGSCCCGSLLGGGVGLRFARFLFVGSVVPLRREAEEGLAEDPEEERGHLPGRNVDVVLPECRVRVYHVDLQRRPHPQ